MSDFLTPRRLTAATDAYDQEQAAVNEVNQRAASQDIVGQQVAAQKAYAQQNRDAQANAARIQREQEAAQRKQESLQKQQVANAKKVGIKTEIDPQTAAEKVITNENGAPVYEHGFQGDPEATPDGQHVAKFRTPQGRIYKVPTNAIRSTQDEAGAPQYEFDLPQEDGTKKTVRQPVGSKPLFSIDPKTGMRYTGAADPVTGSVGTTPIGYDPTARSKAVLEQKKLEFAQQQDATKFQADEITLNQNAKETNLAPLKKQLAEAQKEAVRLAKEKLQYRDDPEKGIVSVSEWGESIIDPASDAAGYSKARAWLDKKAATDKTLAEVKAAHDPLAAEVHTMQQKRNALAIQHLESSHETQVQLKKMEEAHKAGIPIYQPDWQKRLDAARTDPRITAITAQADLDESGGGPLAEDVRRVRVPETAKLVNRLIDSAFEKKKPEFDIYGRSTEATPPMQRPELTMANVIGQELTADNVAPKGSDVRKLTESALGISDPENWQIKPTDGALGQMGYHDLAHKGQPIGSLNTRDSRIELLPPDSAGMDAQQQRLINTNRDGLPIYFASATPPLPAPAVKGLIQQGLEIGRSTPDQGEAEAKLAAAQLAPADLREKVLSGQLSVQDGRLLNETFYGVKDAVVTKETAAQGFQKWLADPQTGAVNGAQFRNGDDAVKREVVNRYFDDLAANTSASIIRPNRSSIAEARQEMLKPFAGPNFLWSGMSAGQLSKQTIGMMPPLIGRGVYGLSGASTLAKWVGLETEADRLSWEKASDENKRRSGFAHRMWVNSDVKSSLEGLKSWAEQADPGQEPPPEVVQKIKDAYHNEFHRLDPESDKNLGNTPDTFDITKDPMLKGLVQRYLATSDPNTFESMHSILAMDAKSRETQKADMAYNDRPIVTTADEVVKRGKGLDLDITPAKAGELMVLGKELDGATDPTKAGNILKRAAGILKLSPQNAHLALGLLTRTESEDPNDLSSIFRAGWSSSLNDAAVEVLSTGLEAGIGIALSPVTAGGSLAAAGASKGVRMGVKTAFKTAYRRTIGAALGAGMERSATFASAATRFNRARLATGEALSKAGSAYARAGIVTPTFGSPLTKLQKTRNLVVTAGKTAAAGMPMEAGEEVVGATGDSDPTLASMGKAAAGGAFGALILSPFFAAGGSAKRGFDAMRSASDFAQLKTDWAKDINQKMSKHPGFTPYTPEDYNTVMGMASNPAQQAAITDHEAAIAELNDATAEHTASVMEMQDAAAGDAVADVPPSPRLLAAQAGAEATAANVEGLAQMAFSATDELRALPEDERALYTGAAKAVSGARDYTQAEAKALMGLGGDSAVAFQQAETLPSDIAGPPQTKTLPGAPVVQPTGLGTYRIPEGVRISIPPQAIESLRQRAPSLVPLIGGSPATSARQTAAPIKPTGQNVPQGTAAQPQPAPAPARNPALASVSDEVLSQRYAQAVELANRPGQPDAATYAKDAAVMAQEIEARKTPNPASFIPESEGGAGKPLPKGAIYDDKTPVTEQEVRAVVDTVIAEEIYARNNRAGRPLIITQPYQANDGGAMFHIESDTVVIDPARLASEIWGNRSSKPTREEVAKAASLVVDHEVVHAAQIQAARATYDKANPTAPAKANHKAFMAWVADHYGQMWKYDFPADVKAAVIETYGKVLEGKPDWQKSFEALRMIVQDRIAGKTSEAATFQRIREHLEAVLAVLKQWYSDVMKGGGKHPAIKAEIEAIEALLANKSPKPAEKEAKTPKSSTQLTLSRTDAAPILAFGESIPKAELYDSLDPEWSDGALETEPHVTVLYGLTKHEAGPVAKTIANHGPVTVTLGKMSLFESEDYDVLKIDVESPELRTLNAKLSKLPNENTFPDYKPHMTIAYLKKGDGKKYVGDARFAGKKITFDTMTFSPPSELRAELGKPELPLTKAAPSLSVQIPLGKGFGSLDAEFRDPESLMAFGLADDLNSARTGTTKEERDAARERGNATLDQMGKDSFLDRDALKQKMLGYRASVVEKAKESKDNLEIFRPVSFHAFKEEGETVKDALPDPTGGEDIISKMKAEEIYRIGPPKPGAGWDWYRSLVNDARDSPPTKKREITRLALAGDLENPRAKLAWIDANIVSHIGGRNIDEAAEGLADSGESFGASIIEALNARMGAAVKPTMDAQQESMEDDALAAAREFKRFIVETEGTRSTTAGALSHEVAAGSKLQIGGEWMDVQESNDTTESITLLSDDYGSQSISGDQPVNITGVIDENGIPVDDLASAPSRSRPRQTIVFTTPIQSPIGAINSYSWASKLEEVTDKSGEVVERRMSDWDKAVTNAETGRDIVHQFEVTQPDGSSKTVSLETALGKLSESGKKDLTAILRAARRIPLREAELQELKARNEDYLSKYEQAQNVGWQSAPEPRLETPDFPPLAERGAKSLYVGNTHIRVLEADEAIDQRNIKQFKQQWATDQIRNLALSGAEQDKMASLQRGIRKDRELLKTHAVKEAAPLSHPPVTHTLPDGYKLTKEGFNTIGSAPTRAYHGTPHKVDKFSMSKVGTGEGAQVYGYGLYYAASRDVAETYANTLGMQVKVKGQQVYRGIDGKTAGNAPISNGAIGLLQGKDWNLKSAQEEASARAQEIKDDPWFQRLADELQSLQDSDIEIGSGNLYTVDLLTDEGEFLDWDRPLSEQSDKVKESLQRHYNLPVEKIGKDVRDLPIDNRQGATELSKSGIPGIRYLDEKSRNVSYDLIAARRGVRSWQHEVNVTGSPGAKDQLRYAQNHLEEVERKQLTHNYVLFDENLVRIIAENGKPVESLASAPSRYQSPTSMLATTRAQMQGAEGEKPAGLASMFNPKEGRPATGERSLFEMPKTPEVPAITPRSIIDASRAASVGQGSAMLPIRAVYEKAKESQPELTPESFMRQVAAMDANETALIGLSETQKAVDAAKPFVVGPAGTEIAFPPELVQSAAILTNLDKVKAVRKLQPDEQAAYDKAEAMLQESETIASAPTESAPPAAQPDNEAQVREILDSMPKVWGDILRDHSSGKSVAEIATARLLKPEQTAYILSQAQGRFDYLRGKLSTKANIVPVAGGEPLFKGGRPDLALSGIPAFAAVGQNRGAPELVTHAEMQDAATQMFDVDPVAAEKLVMRWLDNAGMAFSTDDMPDGIKAIVANAQAKKASQALMTAAAQIFTVENAFAGGSSAKSARLIDLYINSGEEISRAMSQRRDPFESPAERNAWYLQNVLLVPPPSIRAQMKKNPGNKEKILAEWAARADKIKAEMLADGIDIDATFKQMAKERALAAATIPPAIKESLTVAPKSTRQAVKAILEGGSWQDALNASGLDLKAAQKAYNAFRGGLRGFLGKAAAAIRDTLGSAPNESESILPEWTNDVKLTERPIQNAATQALAIQRNRKMAQGELDLGNDLSANKARRAIEARKSTEFDKLSEFWRAAILSGPQTGIVNVVSGLTYGTYEATFKKFTAAALADLARVFGMKPDAPSLRDLPAMAAALIPAFQSAGKDMVKAWNTEDAIFDSFALNRTNEKGELWKEGHTSALKGWVRKIMHAISFRHMGAADEFVKSLFTRIEVVAQARQIARNEGLEGLKMANRISELMVPGSLAWERSLANAKRITFQNQEVGNVKLESAMQSGHGAIDSIDHIAEFIQNAKNGDYGKLLKGLFHVVFPFVATPANILKGGITMSPVGGALAIIDATRSMMRHKQGNVEEAQRIYNAARALDDFTNQLVCWGFILGLSSLVKPGDDDKPPVITGTFGSGDSTPGERELAYRSAPPQSVRLWGKWYSYKKLDPWASWLAPTIDSIREFQLGKSLDEAIPNVIGNMLKAMKEKSYFHGVSEIVNAANDPTRFGQRWALGIATGFMPNAVKQSLRANDEAIRDSRLPKDMGFVDQLGRRLGFGMLPHPSNPLALMPAIDVFGRPVTKSTGSGGPATDTLIRLLSPVEIRNAGGVDSADLMLMHYNMMHDKPFGLMAPDFEIQRTINGKPVKISLSFAEREGLAKRIGQDFRTAIQPYVDKPTLPTEDEMDDIKDLHRKIAKPYEDAAFGAALQKRIAEGKIKL